MTAPPPSPQEKTLRRILFISVVDGWSVILIAGLGMLLTLFLGDLSGLVVGLLVLTTGVMELRGSSRLRRRDPDGLKLMIRAQLLLLTVILVYCASRLGSFDAETVMTNFTPEMEAMLKESGIERADVLPLVRTAFYATYGILAVASLIFQGGLVLYYRARKGQVAEALATPPTVPNSPLA